ncbi:MAG: DUF4422 domain-containing protein [Eggerthellaceae bacterium]|nr:DUF4422 domain-containing protein [Eggerthellaceae bacterium]
MSKMIVATHKEFNNNWLPEDYVVIKVGELVSNDRAMELGWYCDNQPNDNISNQNPWYCELTAQYSALSLFEKEGGAMGLSHYRRFFFNYKKDSKTWHDDVLRMKDAEGFLRNNDIILPFRSVKYPGLSELHTGISDEKQDSHWVTIRNIIYRKFPEYRDSFDAIMADKYTVWGNMFIASSKVFFSYSRWLFEVLKEYDQTLQERGEERIPRVDGFLAEPLLLVWVDKNINHNRIVRLEVRNSETDSFVDYTAGIRGRIMRKIRNNHFFLAAGRELRVKYLVLYRYYAKKLAARIGKR